MIGNMQPTSESPRSELALRRILVVDDDVDFAESLVDILGLCSYEVRVAHSAGDACRLVKRFDARVALLDIRLGQSNGLDLIEELQAIRPGILCVVMTAYSGATSAVEAVEAGAYDYLTKPLGAGDLLATLERCFQNVRLREEKEKIEAALRLRGRELERINTRLDDVLESAQRLVDRLDIEHPGAQILDEFARVLAAEGGSLFLREGDVLRRVETLDAGHAPDTVPYPPAENSIFGFLFRERVPILVSDLNGQGELTGSGWEGYHDCSLIAFPLLSSDKAEVVGVLALHNRTNPPFSEHDLRLGKMLLALSSQALRLVDATLARRESDERFRTVVRTSKYGMVLLAGEGQIALFNPAAESIFGIREEDVLGTLFVDLLCVEDRKSWNGALLAYLNDGDAAAVHDVRLELSVPRTNSEPLPIEMFLSAGQESQRRYVLGIFREISSQRDLEQQLNRVQKMQILGQLAGGVAHDFNNLLQAIIAHSQLALMDLETGGQRAASDLRDVLRAAERAAGLTRQLLTFSRREATTPFNLDLNALILDMGKMLRRLIEADVELVTRLSAEPCVIRADAGQIEQMLMNLCVNARDAIKDKGRIVIETRHLELDEQFARMHDWARPGLYVVLSVRDTGDGMDAQTVKRIFEPFFTTKDDGRGTGLGLAIVYDVVRRHAGLIHVESQPGQGAVFEIYLPRVEHDPAKRATIAKSTPPGGDETILLAEDDDIVRDLTVRILAKAGYRVLTAQDGLEAMRLFDERKNEIDLALLDAIMPKRNGREVYDHIRSLDSGFPILFCSGYSGATLQMEFVASAGVVLIPKPYNREDLLRVVRRTLDRTKKSARS